MYNMTHLLSFVVSILQNYMKHYVCLTKKKEEGMNEMVYWGIHRD